ncbi:MAG TPA: hypothetical protein VHU15_07790 [Stellaceae bacterium]|jgi:hypothetical protein|nr:hypothetical protein [Stellaceae bacterium]
MVRYLLAVAAVVALISGPALAEEMSDMGGSTKIITRSHDGMGGKKVIIKRHADGFVTKKKIIHRDRMFGSSFPEHRVVREREIVR